jgi:hypothetical protein
MRRVGLGQKNTRGICLITSGDGRGRFKLMPTFKIIFVGRLAGALGVRYQCFSTIEADTRTQAITKLYDDYEHVSNIRTKLADQEDAEWIAGW